MKRVISYILFLCLTVALFMCNTNASASDLSNDSDTDRLQNVLKETNRELIFDILNTSHFDQSMQDVNLDGEPMLLIYNTNFHAYAEEDLNSIIDRVHDKALVEIVILSEELVRIREYRQKTKLGVAPAYTLTPTYIEDILNGETIQMFMGESCRITNVICFDALTSYKGVTVVFETDKGVFVRYYDNETAAASEFPWDSYVQYSMDYYEYCTSYEQNYTPNGDFLVGGSVTFLQFCEDPSHYSVSSASNPINYPVIITTGIVIVTVIFLTVLYYKRKVH